MIYSSVASTNYDLGDLPSASFRYEHSLEKNIGTLDQKSYFHGVECTSSINYNINSAGDELKLSMRATHSMTSNVCMSECTLTGEDALRSINALRSIGNCDPVVIDNDDLNNFENYTHAYTQAKLHGDFCLVMTHALGAETLKGAILDGFSKLEPTAAVLSTDMRT